MPRRTTRSMAAAATPGPDDSNSNSDSSRSSPAPRKGRSAKKELQAKSMDKQKILLSSNTGHFSLIRAFHLADLITLMNGFCGVMSIFASLRYCLLETASSNNTSAPTTAAPLVESTPDVTNLYVALAFLPFGLFFDFLDGRVARWRNKSSLMGQELDSLADLISFGAAPAVVAFALGMRSVADTVGLTIFVLCGLARLARFNVTVQSLPKDASGKSTYFEGTPIPTTLGLDAIMAWWVSKGWIGEGGVPGGVLFSGTPVQMHAAVFLFLVHGCLMTSRSIRIPKP